MLPLDHGTCAWKPRSLALLLGEEAQKALLSLAASSFCQKETAT